MRSRLILFMEDVPMQATNVVRKAIGNDSQLAMPPPVVPVKVTQS